MGGLALLIFLISDLRVAGATGSAERELRSASCSTPRRSRRAASTSSSLGAVALTISGIALATLTPEQLGALRPPRRAPSDGAPLGDADGAEPTAQRRTSGRAG